MKPIAIVVFILALFAIIILAALKTNPVPVNPTITPTKSSITITPTKNITNEPTEKIKTEKIEIKNLNFNPKTITINKNTTVVWTNQDNVPHQIVSDPNGEIFKSEILSPGQSYSFTFSKTGEYAYHCGIHTFMKGTVSVK